MAGTDAQHIVVAAADGSWAQRLAAQLRNVDVTLLERGEVTIRRARERPPHLVVTEMALPDMTGIGLCRGLREDPRTAHVPVIVVSAQASELDRVVAFEAGADDFLPAPFSDRELAARVNAVLRRASRRGSGAAAPRTLRLGDLTYFPEAARLELSGRPIALTATELRVLGLLVEQQGRVVTRIDILETIPGAHQAGARSERVVDAHVKAIRKKLGAARDYIQTVRGVGYCFSAPEPR